MIFNNGAEDLRGISFLYVFIYFNFHLPFFPIKKLLTITASLIGSGSGGEERCMKARRSFLGWWKISSCVYPRVP